jgi:hypothetical protein
MLHLVSYFGDIFFVVVGEGPTKEFSLIKGKKRLQKVCFYFSDIT